MIKQLKEILENLLRNTQKLAESGAIGEKPFLNVLLGIYRVSFVTLKDIYYLSANDDSGASALDLARKIAEHAISVEYIIMKDKEKMSKVFQDYLYVQLHDETEFLKSIGQDFTDISKEMIANYANLSEELKKNKNWAGRNIEGMLEDLHKNEVINEFDFTRLSQLYVWGCRLNHPNPFIVKSYLDSGINEIANKDYLQKALFLAIISHLRLTTRYIDEIRITSQINSHQELADKIKGIYQELDGLDLTMYKDTKIIRFELFENIKNEVDSDSDFNLIDSLKEGIKKYIYTNIKMTNASESIEKAFQSRLQILLSSVLLRALMLKEGLVVALNENNFPAYYATLKSFLEVPALLGYVTDLIYKNNDYLQIIPKLNQLYLGNRKAGSFPVGDAAAVNVLTMFDKLDGVMKDIACDGLNQQEKEKIQKEEDIMTSTYGDISNFGHINFNAHLSIGILKGDIWSGKINVDGYKGELYSFYMPAFTIAINVILLCCSLITRNSKVNNFNLLENKYYF